MRISRQSWHYKIWDALDGNRWDTSLCKYVRKLLFAAFAACLVIIIGTFVSILILEPIVSTALWLIYGGEYLCFFNSDCAFIIGELILAGMGTAFIVLFFAFQYIGKHYSRVMKRPITSEGTSFRQVLAEYRRAVKNKVCPKVEFYD